MNEETYTRGHQTSPGVPLKKRPVLIHESSPDAEFSQPGIF